MEGDMMIFSLFFTVENYEELWQWSVDNIAAFWGEVWSYTGIVASTPYEQVVDEKLTPGDVPEWFKGARLNYAENLLKFDDDHCAIIATGEAHEIKKMTYRELRVMVQKCAAAFRASGVVKGDRIVGTPYVSFFIFIFLFLSGACSHFAPHLLYPPIP